MVTTPSRHNSFSFSLELSPLPSYQARLAANESGAAMKAVEDSLADVLEDNAITIRETGDDPVVYEHDDFGLHHAPPSRTHSNAPSRTASAREIHLPTHEVTRKLSLAQRPHTPFSLFKAYFEKWKGVPGRKSPPYSKDLVADFIFTLIGSFFGIGAVAILHYDLVVQHSDLQLLVASFGASAVLTYGVPNSPLAQPRNLVFGHMVSALTGCIVEALLPEPVWLASSLCVAIAIVAQIATKTIHPPGGATALIAVTGTSSVKHLGFLYVLMPVGSGAIILLLVALIVNNAAPHRRYPEFWI
eukprot:GILJ01009648.1.p1 GENE.GILJ01009648.1~~GILJ01009648.1.p1  ORF type:complete len:317 (+),score=23.93 GILJ01009648.1:51-953(+)